MLKRDKESTARALEEMASLLEFKGENPFKVRAYLNAAHALLNLSEDFEKIILEDRLKECEGIGESLSEKIKILATSGTHPVYEELKQSMPSSLHEMLRIPGLGYKKIKVLYEVLKIDTIKALKEACINGKLSAIRGFGAKTEKNILDGINHLESYSKRQLWWDAMSMAAPILEGLRKLKGVKAAEIAGSIRRRLETVGDLDFVVAAANPEPIMEWFISNPFVMSIITHGPAKSSVRLAKGIQAELRIVSEKQFAFVLCYSTGSKNHNIKLRQIALKHGLTLSEWGLEPLNAEVPQPFAKLTKGITEADIYKVLGMEFVVPELREDMGEIEAAKKNALPCLVDEKDIRGVFHVHTSASDGRKPLEDMVKAAEDIGWEYIGISDHSKSSFQANGLYEEKLFEQIKKIRKLNESKKFKPYIFSGVECDILIDGKLDFSNDILKELDFVIASVHSSLHQDEKTMTKRLIKAIENPYTTMLGHVSGRLLLIREPYPLNFQKVIDACIANGKIMELNANPERLDMDWRYWHNAAEKGLICSINPDAHDIDCLQHVKAGVGAARKGWLEKKHIFNTYPLAKVKKKLLKAK